MSRPRDWLRAGDAVLVVDVQPDFCVGGQLPVPEGDAVIAILNSWIAEAVANGFPVAASRDWHPAKHCSFEAQGGPWPVHCVQGTEGAAYHPDLALPDDAVRVDKGIELDTDQYSAFDGTGLAALLRAHRVERVWIGGLALDVCVRATVLDALSDDFGVGLIRSATRAVDPQTADTVVEELRRAGAVVVD